MVLNRSRETWTFNTLEEAFLATKKALRRSAYTWRTAIGTAFDKGAPFAPAVIAFVIKTDLGDAVSLRELEALNDEIVERSASRINKGRFRCGAWPGSGQHRVHRGSLRRLVRTKNERTWAAADDDQMIDHGLDRNACGRRRDLPSSWDGIPRSRSRNWKAQRHTQWR
ncbi:MAG: hypothetical protein DI533_21630 [Cereibacter sphaeroides]|uniref:Uncharacterized protein n=1 Tax=Cereibacter sphaeroides TaxID=1063 RepID=A0A2W5S6L8_CERSP|nr:MAG: hypothetical protein DI533_21630 [Cereibacter sphaeroides]